MAATTSLAMHGGAPVRKAPFPSWPSADADAAKTLLGVLASGAWGSTHGSLVATFETEFARFQSARFCTCVCNATLGLDAAMRAVGVGFGDEVIVPSFTFIASASSVVHCGAIPVFADVVPGTHLIDLEQVEAKITPRTRAVMPVHFAGRPVDMDDLMALCRDRGVAVVEDAAQAHGAAWRGKPVGALGDVGVFSFQSSKNITSGEGGAMVTNDEGLADRLYSLTNVGRIRGGGWYQHESLGFNLRLTEFQAAVLLSQLAHHSERQAIREANAVLLTELLGAIDGVLLAPEDEQITTHGRHLLLFRIPALPRTCGKDAFVRALAAEGIPVAMGYRTGLHRNAALLEASTANARHAGYEYSAFQCPVTDEIVVDTVFVPQHLLLAEEGGMHDIARAVKKVLAHLDAL